MNYKIVVGLLCLLPSLAFASRVGECALLDKNGSVLKQGSCTKTSEGIYSTGYADKINFNGKNYHTSNDGCNDNEISCVASFLSLKSNVNDDENPYIAKQQYRDKNLKIKQNSFEKYECLKLDKKYKDGFELCYPNSSYSK